MNDKLKQSLEELRGELEAIGSDDPKLQTLADHVKQALQNNADEGSLIESLKDATESFETNHPQLTSTMNNVMNSLSGLGI